MYPDKDSALYALCRAIDSGFNDEEECNKNQATISRALEIIKQINGAGWKIVKVDPSQEFGQDIPPSEGGDAQFNRFS